VEKEITISCGFSGFSVRKEHVKLSSMTTAKDAEANAVGELDRFYKWVG